MSGSELLSEFPELISEDFVELIGKGNFDFICSRPSQPEYRFRMFGQV